MIEFTDAELRHIAKSVRIQSRQDDTSQALAMTITKKIERELLPRLERKR